MRRGRPLLGAIADPGSSSKAFLWVSTTPSTGPAMSCMSVEFCDTNVVAYAYDAASPIKRPVAVQLLGRLREAGSGVVSIQVLQELFVTLTKKAAPPLSPGEARAVVSDMATWQVIRPAAEDVLDAVDAAMRWRVSFWDAMLLTTARKAQADTLWSEDLNDGQHYDGVVVRNPFRIQPITRSP